MFLVKHFMEPAEPNDGLRVWVEAGGLTRDLAEWCQVDKILERLGPPAKLADWFERHPERYDNFIEVYHRHLDDSPHRGLMEELALTARQQNITLLHAGEDGSQNVGTALFEFLTELEAYLPEA